MPENSRENSMYPNKLAWVSLSLILIGVVVAAYLTVVHYTTTVTLACPETGAINCAKVTTSPYATALGLPLALWGLLFFLGLLPFHLPMAWRSSNRFIRRGRLVLASSGVVVVFALIYIELFKLNAICLYCTAVHLLTILLFAVTVVGTAVTA